MRGLGSLVVCLGVVYLVAGLGGLVTAPAIPGWYAGLIKPAWTPPSWVFGPAWTLLYTLMAVAAWLVWQQRDRVAVRRPLALFGVQLLINGCWSPVFFGLQQIGTGLVIIVLLWLAIGATILAFWPVRRLAGGLLIPYLLWVTYATTLNAGLYVLNPG